MNITSFNTHCFNGYSFNTDLSHELWHMWISTWKRLKKPPRGPPVKRFLQLPLSPLLRACVRVCRGGAEHPETFPPTPSLRVRRGGSEHPGHEHRGRHGRGRAPAVDHLVRGRLRAGGRIPGHDPPHDGQARAAGCATGQEPGALEPPLNPRTREPENPEPWTPSPEPCTDEGVARMG